MSHLDYQACRVLLSCCDGNTQRTAVSVTHDRAAVVQVHLQSLQIVCIAVARNGVDYRCCFWTTEVFLLTSAELVRGRLR